MLADYVQTDDARAAALLYGITLTVTAVFFNAVWLYAARGGRLLHPGVDAKEVSGITRSYLPGTPMYGCATLVALVSPRLSALLFAVIAGFYMADEKGPDEKIICVPLRDPAWMRVTDVHDIPPELRNEIEHFFQVYKDLEEKKVETRGYGNRRDAERLIGEARARAEHG